MKNIKLYRPIIMTLMIILFSGFTTTFADENAEEENTNQSNSIVQNLDDVNIDKIFCLYADPNQVFVIIDHYNHIIVQGKCCDVMVKFFLSISDPLLEIDNTRYYRLSYENPEIMDQRLTLREENYLKDLDL